jgi:hypothetical protein
MEIIGQIIVGWLLADFVGGVLHWLEDRVLTVSDSWIGTQVVEPAREHHDDPLAMYRYAGLIERNWTTWLPTLAVSIALLSAFGPSLLWLSATIGGLVVYEVHRAAHHPRDLHPFVRVLQDVGVIQSPKHHAGHHRPPHQSRYCPLTDWLNPILDALRFWDRIERVLKVQTA